MIDIILAIVVTAITTAVFTRYIGKKYEEILIAEAYLLGMDDLMNHVPRHSFEEVIEKVETNLKDKLNKRGEN